MLKHCDCFIDPGWGILSHPAGLAKGEEGNGEVKGKGGGEVELGGVVRPGGGSLFPWFPQVTSPPQCKHMK